MGQQDSKPSVEAQIIFQHAGAVDMCQTKDACYTQGSVPHNQRKVSRQPACLHCSPGGIQKSILNSWPQSRDAGGLVLVMDNPTGGVWMKPEQIRTRS